MFSHVDIGARGFARSGAFQPAPLAPLCLARAWKGGEDGAPPGVGRVPPESRVPTFFVQFPFDGWAPGADSGWMAAFLAPSPDAARGAHAAGLAAGGADEVAPAARSRHGRSYHGAHLREPEGDGPCVVHRGDLAGA